MPPPKKGVPKIEERTTSPTESCQGSPAPPEKNTIMLTGSNLVQGLKDSNAIQLLSHPPQILWSLQEASNEHWSDVVLRQRSKYFDKACMERILVYWLRSPRSLSILGPPSMWLISAALVWSWFDHSSGQKLLGPIASPTLKIGTQCSMRMQWAIRKDIGMS